FFEPSTRTRVSFEMAIRTMGATSLSIDVANSSLKKGESLYDMIKNLEAMGIDAIVIRHANGGAPKFVSDITNVPVINAGDGYHEHPTQGLLDIFTMIQQRDTVKGKKVLILGDVAHSRVAKSNIWGLTKLGAEVFVCGPPTLIPPGIADLGVTVVPCLDDIIPEVDFINVLRIQYERQEMAFFPSVREYRALYGLTKDRLDKAKKDVVVLHPGPINRGIELDSEVADGPHNVIIDQVTNGIAVRMAVLYILLTQGAGK
ncbi:aspartate carbamoyltransferase catalytic subunit, partial [bacterium]|nr:aspartate carbamoyltransferase catalytic subunit [bacterium]